MYGGIEKILQELSPVNANSLDRVMSISVFDPQILFISS